MLRSGQLYSLFFAETAGRNLLLLDYNSGNECLAPRTFRMDKLYDLSPELLTRENLFKVDLTDG